MNAITIKTKGYRPEACMIHVTLDQISSDAVWIKVSDPLGHALTRLVWPRLKLIAAKVAKTRWQKTSMQDQSQCALSRFDRGIGEVSQHLTSHLRPRYISCYGERRQEASESEGY